MKIHETAIVDSAAKISSSAEISAYSIIGENVVIGENVKIGPYTVVERNTTIGDDTFIASHATIGVLPQEVSHENMDTSLEIGKNCKIFNGANISRGSEAGVGKTVIGDDTIIMSFAHIGHDCIIGNNVTITVGVALGGHVQIDSYAYLSPPTQMHQYSRIGTCALVFGRVTKDVPPFAICDNGRLSGINRVMMIKKGISKSSIGTIKKAYNIYLNKKYLKNEAMEKVKNMEPIPELKEFIAFVEKEGTRGSIR